MTKGEAGRALNSILNTLEDIEGEKHPNRRIPERLNVIRDQVMLLALDLMLPLRPTEPAPIPHTAFQGESASDD